MSDHLAPGVRVVATDAYGKPHHGVITRGPERPIGRGFIKVWIRFDGRDDEMPWPIDDVRTEVTG